MKPVAMTFVAEYLEWVANSGSQRQVNGIQNAGLTTAVRAYEYGERFKRDRLIAKILEVLDMD